MAFPLLELGRTRYIAKSAEPLNLANGASPDGGTTLGTMVSGSGSQRKNICMFEDTAVYCVTDNVTLHGGKR